MKNKFLVGLLASGFVIASASGFVYNNSFAAENKIEMEGPSKIYSAPLAPEADNNALESGMELPKLFDVKNPNSLDIPVNFSTNTTKGLVAQAVSAAEDKIEVKDIRGRIDSNNNEMVTVIYNVNNGISEIRASQSLNSEDGKITISNLKKEYSNTQSTLKEININGNTALLEENGNRKQVFLATDKMFYAINNAGTNSTIDQLLKVASMIDTK